MIIDMPATTTSAVNAKLVDLRETGGAVALGRVMTLVPLTMSSSSFTALSARSAKRTAMTFAPIRWARRSLMALSAPSGARRR